MATSSILLLSCIITLPLSSIAFPTKQCYLLKVVCYAAHSMCLTLCFPSIPVGAARAKEDAETLDARARSDVRRLRLIALVSVQWNGGELLMALV